MYQIVTKLPNGHNMYAPDCCNILAIEYTNFLVQRKFVERQVGKRQGGEKQLGETYK
jgi:hypothetical protein